MEIVSNLQDFDPKKSISFGLSRIAPEIAEMLFLDYAISVEDAVKIADRLKNSTPTEVREISNAVFESFTLSVNEYEHLAKKSSSYELEQARTRLFEKMSNWSKKVTRLAIEEILKVNEYYRIPVTDLPEFTINGPKDIYKILSNYVVEQNEYIRQLSLAYYVHLKNNVSERSQVGLPRNTLLVSGPTGVGKTLALQVLSRLFGKPFATTNCNSLVSEGIIGSSLSDVFTELYMKYNQNLRMVENACINFDEFDKLWEDGIFNTRIINELLNIIDDKGEVSFRSDYSRNPENIKVSTKNMLFVFSGVFASVREKIKKRLYPDDCSLGFARNSSTVTEPDLYEAATHLDYLCAGIKPEILGRINSFTYVNPLSLQAIKDILLSSTCSPIIPYKRYFLIHNVQLLLTEDGAEAIAFHVYNNGLGARGIKSVINKLLNEFMFNVQDVEATVVLDSDFVNNTIKS